MLDDRSLRLLLAAILVVPPVHTLRRACDAELVPSTAVQVAAVCTFNPTPSTQ